MFLFGFSVCLFFLRFLSVCSFCFFFLCVLCVCVCACFLYLFSFCVLHFCVCVCFCMFFFFCVSCLCFVLSVYFLFVPSASVSHEVLRFPNCSNHLFASLICRDCWAFFYVQRDVVRLLVFGGQLFRCYRRHDHVTVGLRDIRRPVL